MIETDRLISAVAQPSPEEQVFDRTLRPLRLTDFVGQPHMKRVPVAR